MRIARQALLGAALAVSFPLAKASAQSQLIGDKDCYGFGGYPCSSMAEINLPEDRRSAAEAAATNGAQQTDFYSSNFAPLPSVFDVIFPMSSPITGGSLMVGMGGFQADDFGQFLVSLNGVAMPDFFNFQDGALASVERMFTLSAADIASINSLSMLRLSIDRSTSNDGTAFDYFQFDYESTTTTTPEPASLVLVASGLAGIGFGLRRRKRA